MITRSVCSASFSGGVAAIICWIGGGIIRWVGCARSASAVNASGVGGQVPKAAPTECAACRPQTMPALWITGSRCGTLSPAPSSIPSA